MHVRDKLAEYTQLLNKYGPDSPELKEFVSEHDEDREFLELAELTRKLQIALTAPASNSLNVD